MNLERVIFHIKGTDIDEAKEAIKALPEGVLGKEEIRVERVASEEQGVAFILNPRGILYHLELPKGLENLQIYRINEPFKGNGEVSFDCDIYHYIIPALPEEK